MIRQKMDVKSSISAICKHKIQCVIKTVSGIFHILKEVNSISLISIIKNEMSISTIWLI